MLLSNVRTENLGSPLLYFIRPMAVGVGVLWLNYGLTPLPPQRRRQRPSHAHRGQTERGHRKQIPQCSASHHKFAGTSQSYSPRDGKQLYGIFGSLDRRSGKGLDGEGRRTRSHHHLLLNVLATSFSPVYKYFDHCYLMRFVRIFKSRLLRETFINVYSFFRVSTECKRSVGITFPFGKSTIRFSFNFFVFLTRLLLC